MAIYYSILKHNTQYNIDPCCFTPTISAIKSKKLIWYVPIQGLWIELDAICTAYVQHTYVQLWKDGYSLFLHYMC